MKSFYVFVFALGALVALAHGDVPLFVGCASLAVSLSLPEGR